MNIPIVGNYLPLYHFLTALNTQRGLWSSIAKALTRHDPCAASEPGNRTRSPQWLASRGRGLYEPIGATQHADFNEMMVNIDQPLNFLVVPEKIWLKSRCQLEKMIQNEVIAHKIGESTRKRLTSKLRNCLAELYPRKIGPALDKFTWCRFYLLFVCVDIFWNTLKYSKQQNDRRRTRVFKHEFPFWNRHFETKFAQFQEFLHFSLCIPMISNVS